MELILSHSDGTPIYEQITRQLKEKIISGELKEGDALPSMRLLAKELRISVITTKRAYEELERQGFIISQTGRGSFVAPCDTECIREEQRRRMEEYLTHAARAAHMGRIDKKEFLEIANILFEGES